jgi:uncharacterized lipoprotein NlpE involved in copper resistance
MLKLLTTITIVFASLLLVGCANEAQESRNDGEFKIELLFTQDQCRMYRFKDAAQYRYFTTCSGSQVSWSENCGKSCTRSMDIATN